MSKLIKTALIAGLIVLPVSAHAAGKMNKVDTNTDGVITFVEFSTAADARFAKSDLDANGFVTKEERKTAREAYRTEARAKRFSATDANADGALTQAEIDAKMAERKAKMEARKGERSGDKKARMKDGAKKDKRKGKRGDRVNPDTDGDGQVSYAEHTASVQAKFTKLDANADGVLTADEMPKRRGKKGKRGKRGGNK